MPKHTPKERVKNAARRGRVSDRDFKRTKSRALKQKGRVTDNDFKRVKPKKRSK